MKGILTKSLIEVKPNKKESLSSCSTFNRLRKIKAIVLEFNIESKNETLGVNLDNLKAVLRRAKSGSSLVMENSDGYLKIEIIDNGIKLEISSSERIGIKKAIGLKWRFYIKGNKYVSNI